MKRRIVLSVTALALISANAGCNDRTLTTDVAVPEPAATRLPVESSQVSLIQLSVPAVANTVTAVIDEKGGRISDPINGHELKVFPGAVASATIFTMTTAAGYEVKIDLTAVRRSDGLPITQFTKPHKLIMSWKNVVDVTPSRIRIVYLDPSGQLEPFDTDVDRQERVAYTKLTHFSGYAMAIS